VAESLEVALAALKADHDFLLQGGVFTKEMLEAYIELKTEEARLVSTQCTRSSSNCTTAADPEARLTRADGSGNPRKSKILRGFFYWECSADVIADSMLIRVGACRATLDVAPECDK
jgi:hypothetical protein